MYFVKESQYEEHKRNDDELTEYELKSNTLDMLYKEQLTELRDLIFKTGDTYNIEICLKWLKVFNCTSNEEKVARNCLCTLMQQQIKDFGCLQKPFTDLQNCDRNLDYILHELDNEHTGSLNSSISKVTFQSHNYPTKTEQWCTIIEETKNIELKVKTELSQELKILQYQLSEKQIENLKLKEIAEKYRMEKEELQSILNNMNKTILERLGLKLQEIQHYGLMRKQFQFFQHIFSNFFIDKKFIDNISKYDIDFQYILHSNFHQELDKQKNVIARHLCRKFVKIKSKLREKYERQLAVQNQTYKLQLELTRLKCLSIIRQLYINYTNESSNINIGEILKVFSEHFENLSNIDSIL